MTCQAIPKTKPQVLIVGAGFGGLNAAQVLSQDSGAEITVLDRRNYHLFQPLLYQVATAGLSPAEIAVPIRSLWTGRRNVHILLSEVESVDLDGKKIIERTEEKKQIERPFDYLVLACGAEHSYFGKNAWEENAPGLKTLEQATEIRRRLLTAFELAEKESDLEMRKELLTFVVVGGGPTGVELAGAISEISRFTLSKDFRNIDPSRTRVLLIEAGSRILASFSEDLSRSAARDLEKIGVQIWTSTRVTDVTDHGVRFGEEWVRARTILWAAGVEPSPLGRKLQTSHTPVQLDPAGRVIIESDLSLAGHPDVFVIGDQACFKNESGHTLPGLAPVAIQQGRHVARNILASIHARTRTPFQYVDKGQMATIGRKSAIAEYGRAKFTGFFAWLMWLGVHIYYLIGFKNRLFVIFQWGWSYLSFARGARLIVGKEWRKPVRKY